MRSNVLMIAAAVMAGWLTFHAAFSQIPGNNWLLAGLSLLFGWASFVIPLP